MQEYVRISTMYFRLRNRRRHYLRLLILDFFPGPMFLSKLKALCFLILGKKIQALWIFSSFIFLQHKSAQDARFVS